MHVCRSRGILILICNSFFSVILLIFQEWPTILPSPMVLARLKILAIGIHCITDERLWLPRKTMNINAHLVATLQVTVAPVSEAGLPNDWDRLTIGLTDQLLICKEVTNRIPPVLWYPDVGVHLAEPLYTHSLIPQLR